MMAGVKLKAHFLEMDLPHSDDCFVIAFPAETIEVHFFRNATSALILSYRACSLRRASFNTCTALQGTPCDSAAFGIAEKRDSLPCDFPCAGSHTSVSPALGADGGG